MKNITYFINEALKHDKSRYNYHPKYVFELRELMQKLIKERGWNGDFNDIDTSGMTDMDYLFKNIFPLFNGDISGWDVSNVTNMRSMFEECHRFEGKGLNNWDVSKCKDFNSMFKACDSLKIDNIEEWGKKIKPSAYTKHMFAQTPSNYKPSWYKD
jgi:hypothetical protein